MHILRIGWQVKRNDSSFEAQLADEAPSVYFRIGRPLGTQIGTADVVVTHALNWAVGSVTVFGIGGIRSHHLDPLLLGHFKYSGVEILGEGVTTERIITSGDALENELRLLVLVCPISCRNTFQMRDWIGCGIGSASNVNDKIITRRVCFTLCAWLGSGLGCV